MKTLGMILLAVSCLAGSAVAQDAQKTQLANDVIKSMQADKMFDSMAGQIKQMVAAQTAIYAPTSATPEQKAKVEKVQSQAIDLAMEAAKGMVAKMGGIYAEVYSVEELSAMKAFFTSPEGKSMLTKQPQIMQKMMPLVQQMQAELMPKIGALVEQAKPVPSPAATASTEPVSVTTEPVTAPVPASTK